MEYRSRPSLHRRLRDDIKPGAGPQDDYTYHSDSRQTKLRARQFVANHFLPQCALYGHDDGGCDRKDDADLTVAFPQVLYPFRRFRSAYANSWP